MDSFNRPRTWIVVGVTVVSLFLLYQFWVWEIERVEVPPGEFLVVIKLWGKELPPGEVIAPNETYKGIQLQTLADGRHFINPILYSYERKKSVLVPAGQCLVLTRKYGNEIDADKLKRGEILVDGDEKPLSWDENQKRWDGERGIVREPLRPGRYFLNEHAYQWKIIDQVSFGAEQIGVRVLKVGKDPAGLDRQVQASIAVSSLGQTAGLANPWLTGWTAETLLRIHKQTNRYLVPEGYRGVQEKTVAPADYYVNPHAENIIPVDVRSHTVRVTDIEFPSRDGFTLYPIVVVLYNVQPEMAPHLLVTLTDKGELYQKSDTPEDQEKNPILQKVVLPLVRGAVRMEGSKFTARDFIAAQEKGATDRSVLNPKEELQNQLNEYIPRKCRAEGIHIAKITVEKFAYKDELAGLATQINERQQARLKLVSNKSEIDSVKQKLKLEIVSDALKQQKTQVVEAETQLNLATIEAEKRLSVTETKLQNDLKIAAKRLATAEEKAKGILVQAEADAEKIMLENKAKVAGISKAISGFPSPEAFAQFHIMAKLGPALTEIFASDSSEFAKLFAGYLTGMNPRPAGPTGTGSTTPIGR